MSAPHKTALLLGDGGARAAYQVGVLKAIKELLPQPRTNPFPILCATSGGAINAGVLAASAEDFGAGVHRLEAIWSELKIDDVYLDAMDKVSPFRELQKKYGFTEEQTAFIGDDLFDLPLLEIVGFSAAPANAMAGVKRRVDYVTRLAGGNGAVREVADMILAAQRG